MLATVLHELTRWAALAVIIGACLFVDLRGGLFMAIAGAWWMGLVWRREAQSKTGMLVLLHL